MKDRRVIASLIVVLFVIFGLTGCFTTDDDLENKAETAGTETIHEVSNGIAIESITGYTDVELSKIEYLAITVKPRAGSTDINLSECNLTITYENLTLLTLNKSLIQSVGADGVGIFETAIKSGSNYTIINNLTSNKFGLIATHDPDKSIVNTKFMNSGDEAYIMVNLTAVIGSSGLLPKEEISGRLMPNIETEAQYHVTAPGVFSNRIVALD